MSQCPKCKATSGDDWSQCGGDCPMPGSPDPDLSKRGASPALGAPYMSTSTTDKIADPYVEFKRLWDEQVKNSPNVWKTPIIGDEK